MSINQKDVETFFAKYESVFSDALAGRIDFETIRNLYSEQFLAATPRGVRAAAFDRSFEEAMLKGYERYRDLGTKSMTVESLDTHGIDCGHVIARVRWLSVYQKPGAAAISIPFEVSYLLERRGGDLKVFGWIAGDEEELLKAHGVL